MEMLLQSNPSLLAKKVFELEDKVAFILNWLKIPPNTDFHQDFGEASSLSPKKKNDYPPPGRKSVKLKLNQSNESPEVTNEWIGGGGGTGEGNCQCQVCGLRFRTELKLDYHKMKLKHRNKRQKKKEELLATTVLDEYQVNQVNNANDDPLDDANNAKPVSPLEAEDCSDTHSPDINTDDQLETKQGDSSGMKLRTRKRKPEVDKIKYMEEGSSPTDDLGSSPTSLQSESDNLQENNKDTDYQPEANNEVDRGKGIKGIGTKIKRKRKKPVSEPEGTGNFPCPICGVRFPSQAKLNSHKTKEKHVKYQRINGTPKITCEICGYKASGQVRFQRHYVKHTKDKPFLCSLCGKALRSDDTLKLHMKQVHQVEGKNWQCKYCQSWHKSESTLKSHYLIHEGKMDEMCPHCGKMYSNLRRHILEVHEKVRAFECHLCEHKFKKKAHLDRHLGSHANPNRRIKSYHVERPEVYARRKCEKKVERLVGIGVVRPDINGPLSPPPPPPPTEERIESDKVDESIDKMIAISDGCSK